MRRKRKGGHTCRPSAYFAILRQLLLLYFEKNTCIAGASKTPNLDRRTREVSISDGAHHTAIPIWRGYSVPDPKRPPVRILSLFPISLQSSLIPLRNQGCRSAARTKLCRPARVWHFETRIEVHKVRQLVPPFLLVRPYYTYLYLSIKYP